MKPAHLFVISIAVLLSVPSFAADGPRPDAWHNLTLNITTPSQASQELGTPVSDKPDRLFIHRISRWFESGLNHKNLRKQVFKAVEGFSDVALYYKEDKLVVIQLSLSKGIEPTALKNIYGIEFQLFTGGMEAAIPAGYTLDGNKVQAKNYPSEYSLVAIAERSVISASVNNSGFGTILRQSAGVPDVYGSGFPGKVKMVQLISRTLESRAGGELLK